MSLNIGALAGDLYFNSVISAALEIVAKLVLFLVIDWRPIGRRLTLSGCLVLSSVFSLLRIATIIFGVIIRCNNTRRPVATKLLTIRSADIDL